MAKGRHRRHRFLNWRTALGAAAASAVVITTTISGPAGASTSSGYACSPIYADRVFVPAADGTEFVGSNGTEIASSGGVHLTPGTWTSGSSSFTITLEDVKTCGGGGTDPTDDTDAPDTDAPDTEVPDTDAPDTDAPDTDAPDTDAPDTDAPDTDAPDTDAPETPQPAVDLCSDIDGDQAEAYLVEHGLHQADDGTCPAAEPDPVGPRPTTDNSGGLSSGGSNSSGSDSGNNSGESDNSSNAGNQQPAPADCPPDAVPAPAVDDPAPQQEEFYFSGVGGAG